MDEEGSKWLFPLSETFLNVFLPLWERLDQSVSFIRFGHECLLNWHLQRINLISDQLIFDLWSLYPQLTIDDTSSIFHDPNEIPAINATPLAAAYGESVIRSTGLKRKRLIFDLSISLTNRLMRVAMVWHTKSFAEIPPQILKKYHRWIPRY